MVSSVDEGLLQKLCICDRFLWAGLGSHARLVDRCQLYARAEIKD